MLKSLTIQNFVLIKHLDIDFEKGFTAITGETGSGKSIIMGALGLVLGQRVDSKMIFEGEDKCVIEACFDIEKYNLKPFFEEEDLDYDPQTIIRREIMLNGKSRAFINDTPISLQSLKKLSDNLIDIHSQHQNLLLSNPQFQIDFLDLYVNNVAVKKAYFESYKELKAIEKRLSDLQKDIEKDQKETDYLSFQFQQLSDAKLQEGEQNQIEEELKILSNAELIKSQFSTVESLLENDEVNVLSMLRSSMKSMSEVSKYIEIDALNDRLNSAFLELQDIAHEVASKNERIEFSNERLDFLNERINLIYELEHKHQVGTVEDLIAIRNGLEERLQAISSSDELLESLRKDLADQKKESVELAKKLSKTRIENVSLLETKIKDTLVFLGMPNVEFKINIKTNVEMLTENGIDEVVFMFSANKNVSLQPIANIASGGEMARLMLTIKSLLSEKRSLPTIIFDEVDTGVSGEIADKMATIMRRMGENMQVIAITHLPQVASKGQHQYKVYKKDIENRTETSIVKLTEDERVEEIAYLLSGASVTEVAIQNAKELLKN